MSAQRVKRLAKELLASGQMADDWTRSKGVVGTPLPVEQPQGRQRSWFVPILHHDLIIGFFEFDLNFAPLRFSSFLRRSGLLDGAPDAKKWLDTNAIKRTAAKLAKGDEELGEPYLSYDRAPSRLAWALPLKTHSRTKRIVYVAGDTVYEAAPETGTF